MRQCMMHPHVAQFRETFRTRAGLAIVMEYASGGDLRCATVRGALLRSESRPAMPCVALQMCHLRVLSKQGWHLLRTRLGLKPFIQ